MGTKNCFSFPLEHIKIGPTEREEGQVLFPQVGGTGPRWSLDSSHEDTKYAVKLILQSNAFHALHQAGNELKNNSERK